MLRLEKINITQFKNYKARAFDFSTRIIGIWGNNGLGKTNLLDAIHYLCFTKSYFGRSDVQNVLYGTNGFRIEGNFVINDLPENAVCILRETGKKEFSINHKVYERFSHHIGHFPCVVIAPDDAVLITGESKERRTFLDTLIAQFDKDYLQHLINYQKLLQQRNSSLKVFAETGKRDYSLLDVLDSQMTTPADYIFKKRASFLLAFLPRVIELYHEISQHNEKISLIYESSLHHTSFEALIKIQREKDLLLQRTNAGIHRDEIEIKMDDILFKNTASQGQRKSLLFALKLAEVQVLKEEKGFAPLLLLDDVFEKLDENRIENLLKMVCIENEGQVFITDTNKERLNNHLKNLNLQFQLIGI